jgi:hypothetical protein
LIEINKNLKEFFSTKNLKPAKDGLWVTKGFLFLLKVLNCFPVADAIAITATPVAAIQIMIVVA